MSKPNDFTKELHIQLDSITDIVYAITIQSLAVKHAIKRDHGYPHGDTPKLRRKFGSYFYGTSVPIDDYKNSKDWRLQMVRRPYIRQNATEEEPHLIANEAASKSYSHLIATAFEATEHYIISIYSLLLFKNRNGKSTITLPYPKQDVEKTMKNVVNLKPGTPAYFREFTKKSHRSGLSVALKTLEQRMPAFNDKISKDTAAIRHFIEVYTAIEFMRHVIVHNDGVYDDNKLSRLTPSHRSEIRDMTRNSILFKKRMILPTSNEAEAVVRYCADMSLFLHQCISQDLNLDPVWLKSDAK